MSRLSRVAFLLILAAVCAIPAFAQSGVIQGTILDPQGAAIVNAKITALDEAKQLVVSEAYTQTDGSFQLRPLRPATYTVKAEFAGFKAMERKSIVLDPNQILGLGSMTMEVGQTIETITVEAQTPLVETTTSNRGFVLTSRQVTEISLNGRDFQSLLRTLPGIVSNDTSDFRLAFNNTDAFNVNGLRGSHNNFYLDGSINTDVGANDGQYTQLSMDAVGEFKEQAGVFNAEYGRNPGVLLSATVKSGTRQFHGTAYEFLRNNAFDARKPNDTTGSVAKLNFSQFGGNLGGPVYLGKVSPKSDPRVFFFFNYEGTRATRPNGTNFVDTVTPDFLKGDFSKNLKGSNFAGTTIDKGVIFQPGTIVRDQANNIIGGQPFPGNQVPQNLWSRNAQAFLKVVNQLDRSKGAPVATDLSLVRVPIQDFYHFRKDQKTLRVDWAANSKTNFFFRWVDDAQRESQAFGIFSSNSYPILPQYRKKPGSSWSWNLINTLSPTMTNELIFTYNHLTQVVDITEDTDPAVYDQTKLGFTFKDLYAGANTKNKYPRFSCGTACNYNSFPSNWVSAGKTFAWTDNLTKIQGAHTFKTGVLVNRNNNGQQPSWTDALNINFGPNAQNPMDTNNQTANMLLGNYTSVSETNGRFFGSFRFFGIEAFGQDSWKATRRLTLEMGVRWAYLGPTNTYGPYLQNYFVPSAYDPAQAVRIVTASGLKNGAIVDGSGNPFNGMVEEGKNGLPLGGVNHRYNNIAPRFGFAWDVFGNGKTSVRGGAGVFYERIRQNNIYFDGLGNPPLSYTPTLYGGNVDNIGPDLVASGTRFPVGVTAIDRLGKIPTIYSWSFGVQHELNRQTSLDLAYVGNSTAHLMYNRDINQLPLGTTVTTPVLKNANNTQPAIRPYKGYNAITYTDFGANSNYNSLQTRVSRRFAKSLTFNASYVWSKALDDTDTDGTGLGYYLDRGREYGPAGFDRTHVFNFDYVWELPAFGTQLGNRAAKKLLDGWQVSGVTRFWSGQPLTITSGGNPGTLGGGVRADYIGGDIVPANRDEFNYFNPLAFARPADGQLGNLGRNTLRAPGINNFDASLFKSTNIGERVRVQLRFEFFNIFNHTQWAGVNVALNSAVANPGERVTQSTRGQTGQINGWRDPRSIQMSMKMYF